MPTIEFILKSKFDATGANQALAKWRELAQIAMPSQGGDTGNIAQSMQTAAQATARLQTQLAGVQQQVRAIGQESRMSFEEGIFRGLEARGIKGLDQTIAKLREMAVVSRQLSERSFDAGMLSRGAQFAAEAEKINGIINRLGGSAQQTASSFAGFGTDALSALNKVGFGLFLITSNLRTLQIVAEAAFNAALEGATKLDVFNAYSRMTKEAGISTARLTNELRSAAQGLITVQTAQQGVNRAILAGVPELAEAAPRLLRMATAAATVTGRLEDVDRIYSTLITGVLRGSPLLIDNADVYVKIGDANEKYADSLGKTVEELTEYEKQIAVLNAVLEQEEGFLQRAGEAGESYSGQLIALRTSAEEAGSAIKTTFAALASIPARDTGLIADLVGDLIEAKTGIESFNDGLLRFAESVIYLSAFGSAAIESITAHAKNAGQVLRGVALMTEGIATQNRDLIGLGMLDYYLGLNEAVMASNEAVLSAIPEAQALIEELRGALGLATLGAEELGDTASSSLRNGFLGPLDEIIASLEYIGSEEYRLTQDLAENWENYRERLEEIENAYNDRLIELREARNERLKDLEQQLAEQQADINEDLADQLEDITNDANRDTEDANEDYHKDLEKAEEDHQRRINDIMKRFAMARLRALIDRDARALFEAERKRDEDLESENDSYAQKIQDLDEHHQEELERIEEQEERKRQEAIERAEERREDAIESYEKQRQDALDAYDEQVQDAQENYQKQREQAKKAAKDREKDLQESYAERAYIAEAGELRRLAIEAKAQLQSETNMFNFFLGLKDQIKDYYNFLEEYEDYEFPFAPDPDDVPDLPGGDGGTGGTGGNGGNPVGPTPCASGEGGTVPCNTPNQLYVCTDGSKYVCIGGKWRRTYGGAGNNTSATTGGGTFMAGGNTGFAPGSNGGAQRVTIRVEGDKTLEQIFNEIAYDAFVELIA